MEMAVVTWPGEAESRTFQTNNVHNPGNPETDTQDVADTALHPALPWLP